jgi:flavin reductase (DIM6/NTAB) family NADH-FMN oxidoreductase RutF
MDKVKLGPSCSLYPMPTTVVGANVDGKANFLAIAFVGIVDYKPPLISIALSYKHHTTAGIRANGSFSVNIPSTAQVAAVDYIGIHSGKNVDKSRIFTPFYGVLGTAPMAAECPLNLECRLFRTLELPGDVCFIGEIVETYARPEVVADGAADLAKLDAFVFAIGNDGYFRVGERFATAWEVGKDYRVGV